MCRLLLAKLRRRSPTTSGVHRANRIVFGGNFGVGQQEWQHGDEIG
jgi:hypothetical protein